MSSKLHAIAVSLLLAAVGTPANAVAVPGQGTWQTTLQPRDLDGDGLADAFFDTTLNLTWLRNANVSGRISWDAANTWAANLTTGGYHDWRLPTMIDTGTPGCSYSPTGGTDCQWNVLTKVGSVVYSEMAHLFHVTLGNKAFQDLQGNFGQPGWGLANTGNFTNLIGVQWTNLEYSPDTSNAWYFGFFDGSQNRRTKIVGTESISPPAYAMAVRVGDV